MKLFKLNKDYSVACEWQNTRSGFRHVAVVLNNGTEVNRVKVTYLNRTWEAYEFETVLLKAIDSIGLSKRLYSNFRKKIEFYPFG